MNHGGRTGWCWAVACWLVVSCGGLGLADEIADGIVVYSGRGKSLVHHVVTAFERETGIQVKVRYGKTSALSVALLEEGQQSPADIFWAQDAGALGALSKAKRLRQLPDDLLLRVPARWRSKNGHWVATSGRARVLAYASHEVATADLPRSVLDLTDRKWQGKVGWAPTNASFQAFVTAMRTTHGETATGQWLTAMKSNGTKAYPANSPILDALAKQEVTVGLLNHYYLHRFKEQNSDFPVTQTFFEDGDIGNLMNVAGAGILRTSGSEKASLRFIEFLLSAEAQAYFSRRVHEYPVVEGTPEPQENGAAAKSSGAPPPPQPKSPRVDLDGLDDLEGTLALLRKTGVL